MSNFKKKQLAISDTDVRSIDESTYSIGGLFRRSTKLTSSGSDSLSFSPNNTIYVSLSGSDAGTGSFDSPLRTISAAYASIQDATFSNKYIIQLGVGTFEEDSLNIKGNVALLGAAPGALGADDENFTRITVTGVGGNKIELDSGVTAGSLFIFKELVFKSDFNLDFSALTGSDLVGIDFFHCSHNGSVAVYGSPNVYSFVEGYLTQFGSLYLSNTFTYFTNVDMDTCEVVVDGTGSYSFSCSNTGFFTNLSLTNPGPSTLTVQLIDCPFYEGDLTTSGSQITLVMNATSFPTSINSLNLDSGNNLFKTTSAYSIYPAYGDTSERPSGLGINNGFSFFDSDLGIPLWWFDGNWVTCSGTPV